MLLICTPRICGNYLAVPASIPPWIPPVPGPVLGIRNNPGMREEAGWVEGNNFHPIEKAFLLAAISSGGWETLFCRGPRSTASSVEWAQELESCGGCDGVIGRVAVWGLSHHLHRCSLLPLRWFRPGFHNVIRCSGTKGFYSQLSLKNVICDSHLLQIHCALFLIKNSEKVLPKRNLARFR